MKYISIIGIISILLLIFPLLLSAPVQARHDINNTTFIIAIVVGNYTTAEKNSDRPWLLNLTGNFLVSGPGWSDPPGYAQPVFGFFIEKCTKLQGVNIRLCRNHHIFGLWV